MFWRVIHYVTCFGIMVSASDVTKSTGVKNGKTKVTGLDHNPVCPNGCVTCSAYNGCVICQRTHFLFLQWHGMRQTGSCVEECPFGFYGIRKKGHGKCLNCSIENCEACSNRTTCSSCLTPFYLVNGQCADRCPEALPFASPSRRCKSQVDCEVSAWSVWGACNRKGLTCGYKNGIQTRKRRILQTPSENGLQCPVTSQSRKCRMKHRFCEDTETNKSDLTKVRQKEINWKRLERLLIKHRKRKQRLDASAKKTKQRKKKNKEDLMKQQTKSPV